MATNKRRKIDDTPQLSAFAARRSVKTEESTRITSNHTHIVGVDEAPSVSKSPLPLSSSSSFAKSVPRDDATSKITLQVESNEVDSDSARDALDSEEDTLNPAFQSRAESPEVFPQEPAIVLSTFRPNKTNTKGAKGGTLTLKLTPGERLVILGEYELSVRKGQITLLGATLGPSNTFYRVFAPSTHSLPVLRCLATDASDAEVKLRECDNGVGVLKPLSSLFGKLWNDDTGPLGPEYCSLLKWSGSSTFQILYSSTDGPQKAYLQPIISTPEWNQTLSRYPVQSTPRAPTTLICGPKSSGKSTFAKLLMNKMLSATTESNSKSGGAQSTGIAILDLDPGQPEYSPQGQLSLIHLHEPNFGPPFTHPVPSVQSRVIRAHTVGAVTPSLDPALYMECALDLFSHYRNLLSIVPKCPLIINTPGWVLGTGLEILTDLISKLRPTEVIYMSQDGPYEVVESLREVAKNIPVLTLPSQASEYATRTAAHLRTMQAMSYFHLQPSNSKGLAWDGRPLTSVPPWEIKYSGEGAGILGITCYGEQPPPSQLLEAINGSLVAVVVVDDMAAIPGWGQDSEDQGAAGPSIQFDSQEIRTPLIVQTPKENLPYFDPVNTISLSPTHSHCIGLALVRGIDVPRQRLQVLTPISPKVIQEINNEGKSIILVSGKFDTPGWAYIEELVQKDTAEKESRKGNLVGGEGEEEAEGADEAADEVRGDERKDELVDRFDNVPWVERLKGSQGRGVGARVWRVRRDLGKGADGD